ncbi:MAG TPA: isoleucine--tRNA ligase [Thermoguttaceae bacterium]|nr:isoleucine--tRNA ligase [Thermoguttaceae bacterium]
MFHPVESSVSFPKLEEAIIRLWKEREIYEKSLRARAGAPPFVFYEGPPTANGLPHPGHCLTRAIKDLFPRYKTMRGYRCDRKAGWDTHGLPVEVEVCKELGIHSKKEIEEYGIERFIRKCVQSVFRYTKEWEELTERLGFWIHLDDPYVTYHQSYVESVWWALKNLFDRGLLYQGHKIVWWWAQGGTALSSGEVGQGYREVADPSVYVRFPLVEQPGSNDLPGNDLTGTDLLVWTTTPWTLPSNQFAAVKPDLEYSVVSVAGEDRKLVMASALVEEVASKSKKELTVESTLTGEKLIGRRYIPPFRFYYDEQGGNTGKLKSGGGQHVAWRVVRAEFVTVDTGTGVVHQAPAFGEVDYDVLLEEQARFVEGEGPPLICSVAPDGTFTEETPEFQGRWVKEADGDICRQLKADGVLFHWEQYLHDYPFCWRAEEDPLIQYPRRSWFVRTTAFKDKMLANNRRINWLPDHIRDGRFGNFLETNVDWALSRERYWGTPLPIWVCEETGYMEAVASYDELLSKPGVTGTEVWEDAKKKRPELPDDLKVHKPYIDAITYDSPQAPGKRMRRVSEVIDCWFDSGAMPFAQWGYPHRKGSIERFRDQFPADFISEALDQTRGWFYSLLAISTLLFSENGEEAAKDETTPAVDYPHPYQNCIVLGLMLAEWWEDAQSKRIFLSEDEAHAAGITKYTHRVGKMSKSLRNYREPNEIFRRYGADALRWYFFANQPPWTSIQYSERAIKEAIPEFLLTLWHCYSFFVIYANIDGFDPAEGIPGEAGQLGSDVLAAGKGYRPAARRGELDRWVLSELHRAAAAVTERMDAYDNYAAASRLTDFIDALSNWYVRRSRDRFWSGEESADKTDAHWTLYECLLTTSKLIAPFVPFLAEAMWQNLAVAVFGDRVAESVHLCDYPTGDASAVDEALSRRMALVREIVSSGRSARMGAKLKVRQPLSLVEVVLSDSTHRPWLENHAALICDELNVKRVEFTRKAEQYISYTVLPDLKRLGPRLGKRLPALRKQLAAADGGKLLADLEASGRLTFELPDGPVTLDSDDVQVRLQAKEGWAAAQGRSCVVVLSAELTEELIAEGLAREVVRAIQDRRKEMGCQYTDRIVVGIVTDSTELRAAVDQFREYVMGETLAVEVVLESIPDVEPIALKLAGYELTLCVKVVIRVP